MPFKSDKQRRYLFANEPEIAKRWNNMYKNKITGLGKITYSKFYDTIESYYEKEGKKSRLPKGLYNRQEAIDSLWNSYKNKKNWTSQQMLNYGGGLISKLNKISGLGALPKMKKVEFWAKEWFQKSAGNSYFAVKVYVNDKIVGTSPVRYGYGSAYEEEGMKILKKAGYLRGVKAEMPSRYFRERAGVKYTGSINSVKREKDLKDFANS